MAAGPGPASRAGRGLGLAPRGGGACGGRGGGGRGGGGGGGGVGAGTGPAGGGVAIVLATATARGAEPEGGRTYLLERVDDAAVVQLYADGFRELPREQKVLIWHLYQAALAGRDIYYDQRYAHGLEMRAILEA